MGRTEQIVRHITRKGKWDQKRRKVLRAKKVNREKEMYRDTRKGMLRVGRRKMLGARKVNRQTETYRDTRMTRPVTQRH